MIDDLDRSLVALLQHALPATLVPQVQITFATPDSQFPPTTVTLPAIDLFLYDVRENTDRRSNEWNNQRLADGSITRSPPPTRVDCSYLVTAWPSASSTTPAFDEHRLLGEVLRVQVQYRALPLAILQGSMATTQQIPPPISILRASTLQSVAEFWQALGGRPKATLTWTVTISVPAGEPVLAGPPVLDERLRIQSSRGVSAP